MFMALSEKSLWFFSFQWNFFSLYSRSLCLGENVTWEPILLTDSWTMLKNWLINKEPIASYLLEKMMTFSLPAISQIHHFMLFAFIFGCSSNDCYIWLILSHWGQCLLHMGIIRRNWVSFLQVQKGQEGRYCTSNFGNRAISGPSAPLLFRSHWLRLGSAEG